MTLAYLKKEETMSFIEDIFVMDEIFSLEQKVGQEYGIPIPNVSFWDSSVAFQKQMAKALILPPSSLPWNYYYTYSIPEKDRLKVLKNLGISLSQLQSTMGLLLQSSTIAIVNMVNLLVHYNYKKLCILQPAYFSVASCCSMLSLKYETEQISFVNEHPKIPVDIIKSKNYDCIWITSPIFCTGYYFDDSILKDIIYLKSLGMTLIFDESLALPGKELVRSFQIDKKTFAIYSPHKAISINGLKFSVIVCDKSYEDFLEQWVDVFSGALSGSNRDAVFHYISPNYLNGCFPIYKEYINHAKKSIINVIKQYPFVSMLPNTYGHYINLFTDLKIHEGCELINLVNDIIHTSLASFIPATLNGFDSNQGFGFRINLTGDILEIEGAVGRILKYLSSHY